MPLISKVSKGQVITAEKMNTIIDALNEARITSVVGGQFSRGLGGTTITIPQSRGGGGVTQITYPFQFYRDGEGFGLTIGTINGIIPNNFSATFGLAVNTEYFVNLECSTDGTNVQSAEIIVGNSPPPPNEATEYLAPISFALNVLYIDTSGKPFRTIGTSPIAAIPQEVIREAITGVGYGELPYKSWYTWIFAS
jgi:hypothetical protein